MRITDVKVSVSAREIPRLNRILFSDAIATIVGAFSGTSKVMPFVELASLG
jgi:xanthine/uracil/vitamin C permease (AzgA family)